MGRNRRRNRKKRARKKLREMQSMPWHNRSGGKQLKSKKGKSKFKKHYYATLFYTAGVKPDSLEVQPHVLELLETAE